MERRRVRSAQGEPRRAGGRAGAYIGRVDDAHRDTAEQKLASNRRTIDAGAKNKDGLFGGEHGAQYTELFRLREQDVRVRGPGGAFNEG